MNLVTDSPTVEVEVVDSIVIVRLRHNSVIDFEQAKQMVRQRKELFPGIPVAVLLDLSPLIDITQEARAYFSSKEALENGIATACISKSIYHKIIYNFFTTFYKPQIPIRFFHKEEDGRVWLTKIRKAIYDK